MKIKIRFDFSPGRYLSQKFPPLCNPIADRYSDLGRRDSAFRLPSAWKVEEADQAQLRQLRRSAPSEVELEEKATVADAVKWLNDWFIAEARSLIPPKVVCLLHRWLSEEWDHFSTDRPSEEYLWSYLSLLGDGGMNLPEPNCTIPPGTSPKELKSEQPGMDCSELRCTIPPLVGRVEVAAYTIQFDGEGEHRKEWLPNEGRFVHLCDRLGEVFCESAHAEDAHLWIDYRSAGLARDWIERRNNFPYWPGAMQATEHRILRMKEVDQPRAERTVSRMFREPLAHSIRTKLPRVWQTVLHAAKAIDNRRCRELVPIWFDEGFLLGAHAWGAEGRWAGCKQPRNGPRASNIEPTAFMSADDLRTGQMNEAIRWLRTRSGAGRCKPDPSVFEDAFSRNCDEASLFVADLAEVKRQQVWEERQALFELHRGVCESLETVIRRRFVEEEFKSGDKGFGFAFREWIEKGLRVDALDSWDDKIFGEVFNPILRRGCVGHLQPEILRLDGLVDAILAEAKTRITLGGDSGLGSSLSNLLDVKLFGPCSDPSGWRNALDNLNPGTQLSDLLLAAKLLIEVRNKLSHGTIDDSQLRDDEVVVRNHEKKFCVRLTHRSLEQCFRLLVSLLNAFDRSDTEEKSVWQEVCSWLEAYEQATPGVECDRVPGSRFTKRLSLRPQIAARLAPRDSQELHIRVVRSQLGFDIHGYKAHCLSRGIQELVLLFAKERKCLWLERGSRANEEISTDGLCRSSCFPGLWLDVRAFFDGNRTGRSEFLRRGLDSQEHEKWVRHLQGIADR